MESKMKLFKLILCGSLILSPIGCASQRETTLLSRPAAPTETSPSTTTESTSAEAPQHPIRDGLKKAASTAGEIIAAPFAITLFLIYGFPHGC
jgi:hypothetical protein